jgi:predicted transcriptional regulator
MVDATAEIDQVFPLFAQGAPAVMVHTGDAVVGMITKADLLDFATGQKRPDLG